MRRPCGTKSVRKWGYAVVDESSASRRQVVGRHCLTGLVKDQASTTDVEIVLVGQAMADSAQVQITILPGSMAQGVVVRVCDPADLDRLGALLHSAANALEDWQFGLLSEERDVV